MDWDYVLRLDSWKSLSLLCPNAHHVAGTLYRAMASQYLVALPYDWELRRDLAGAPFVSSVVWARCAAAAARCNRQDDVGDGESLDDQRERMGVPRELLFGYHGSYADLARCVTNVTVRRGREGRMESDTYDMQGRFVHRTLSIGRIVYYFSARDSEASEEPYAVRVCLPPKGGA